MGPTVLLKNFTFALAPSQTFSTDWVPFPSEHTNAVLQSHLQPLTPAPATTGVKIQLETSYDTVAHPTVGTGITTTSTGSPAESLSSDLGPLVRAVITNTDTNSLHGTVSVFLQPKSD